jgi:hypothetical protein
MRVILKNVIVNVIKVYTLQKGSLSFEVGFELGE